MGIKCYNNANTQFAPFIHFPHYSYFSIFSYYHSVCLFHLTRFLHPFFMFSLFLPTFFASLLPDFSPPSIFVSLFFVTSSFVTFSLLFIAYFQFLNFFCLCILVFIDLRLFQDACSTELRNTRAERRCSE